MTDWGPTFVAASSDDAYSKEGWSEFDLTSAYPRLGAWYGCNPSAVALRFLNVTIPKNATINSAVVTFEAGEDSAATTVSVRIFGEANASPATFTDLANWQARSWTTAYVDWTNIGSWTVASTYNSPDIAAVIQEIVNLAGWASGNNLVLAFKNNGSTGVDRLTVGYDANPATCARLSITYTPPVASSPPRMALLKCG